MKAFDHDVISFTVLGVSGCIESRASPWDKTVARDGVRG